MRKFKLNFFDKLIFPIAIFLAIALLIGGKAHDFDPRTHIYITFLGLAYPFLLVANLLVIFYWLLRTKWTFAIVTIVCVGLGWQSLKNTYSFWGSEGENAKSKEEHLRLMTYNVHQFKPYGLENDESTKNDIVKLIAEQNPDVVCFQEFYSRFKGKFDLVDSIKKILNLKYYYFEPSTKNDYEAFGLAIFSKYPIKNKGHIIFEEGLRGNESIYVDLAVNGKLLRIYDVHFQSISFQKQDYEYLDRMATDKKPEVKSSRRIASMLKFAFQKRASQVEVMKEKLAATEIPYVIAGDFNDTPASFTVAQITKDLRNAFREKGQGFGKTYNGKFPNFQIDYIACTKDIEVINYHISEAKLSDHFPVRSDLKLNYATQTESE